MATGRAGHDLRAGRCLPAYDPIGRARTVDRPVPEGDRPAIGRPVRATSAGLPAGRSEEEQKASTTREDPSLLNDRPALRALAGQEPATTAS